MSGALEQEPGSEAPARSSRWHLLYYALALFDLVTVTGSLSLNHQIMGLYSGSVAENLAWAERLDTYAALGHWAQAVNAPGNDVFDSRDVASERARLEQARATFDARLADARRALAARAGTADAQRLLDGLDRVAAAMDEMTLEAARIFAYFEAGQPERAGERMATMDRKYAGLTAALADLNARVRSIQNARFERQLEQARSLRRAEWAIAALIGLMVSGALLFGHRIRRQMERAERQRQAHDEGLRRAQAAAESASRAKSRFLANMSHEIRTPLNGVLGMTELLMATRLDAEQRECTATIQQSGNHLLEVISDVLDFSKIEAGRIELEAVSLDVCGLIEEVAASSAERAHRKGLELVYEVDERIPAALVGDPMRLRQVLLNLVSNAVKFTERGEIALRARCAALESGACRVQFSVSDTGIGIAPEEQSRIFAPFAQADESTTRRFGGTGLGLAISRELVERMGGRLGVESVIDVGSRFGFEVALPIDVDVVPRALGTPQDLRGLRVLVVDDNATNRTILSRHLASWGADAVECASGAEALAALRRAGSQGLGFSLGVFDLSMPGMDGLGLVEAIESDPALGRLPVVLLTSMDVASGERAAKHPSVALRLNKPCRKAQLHRALLFASGRASSPLPRSAEPLPNSGRAGARVLLVEDNAVNQQVALAMLARLGWAAECAVSGGEAVRRALAEPPALILMDCELPDMDGLEATRQIRALSAELGIERVPIVALTGHATLEQRAACLEAGMDEFLSKPIALAALQECLERHVHEAKPGAAS